MSTKTPQGIKSDGTSYKILLVDDSMFVRRQLEQILLSEKFEIACTAENGKEGVDKYKESAGNIDLVTMDITMPVMDGVTALENIMNFDKNAKVIMISALGKQDLVKKSLILGAKNYIVKPLDRVKVLERVVNALND